MGMLAAASARPKAPKVRAKARSQSPKKKRAQTTRANQLAGRGEPAGLKLADVWSVTPTPSFSSMSSWRTPSELEPTHEPEPELEPMIGIDETCELGPLTIPLRSLPSVSPSGQRAHRFMTGVTPLPDFLARLSAAETHGVPRAQLQHILAWQPGNSWPQ